MNYLAHILLSGEDKQVQIGNFMGDAVKGKAYNNYPIQIRKGLLLHRKIDSFTDSNIFVKQSKRRLNSRYGHYSSVLIDVFYDYLLAKNWKLFTATALDVFINNFYQNLEDNYNLLHPETQHLARRIIQSDWMKNYTNLSGIEKVLIKMEGQIIHDIPLHLAIEDLKNNLTNLEIDFLNFFPLIQEYSIQTIDLLNKKYDVKN